MSMESSSSGLQDKWKKAIVSFTNNIDTVEDDNIKISIFKRDFPSLFNTLQSFEKMIDYTCE